MPHESAVAARHKEAELIPVRAELEAMSGMGHVPSSMILRHGREGRGFERPDWLRCGPMGMCYRNAVEAVVAAPALVYVEGYAARPGLPLSLAHARVLDPKTGQFLDPTWPEPNGEYFGIPFRSKYVFDTIARAESYGLLGWNARLLPADSAAFLAQETGEQQAAQASEQAEIGYSDVLERSVR